MLQVRRQFLSSVCCLWFSIFIYWILLAHTFLFGFNFISGLVIPHWRSISATWFFSSWTLTLPISFFLLIDLSVEYFCYFIVYIAFWVKSRWHPNGIFNVSLSDLGFLPKGWEIILCSCFQYFCSTMTHFVSLPGLHILHSEGNSSVSKLF